MPLPDEADRCVDEPLTPREQDVVALLLAGVTTNRELAARMVVTNNTVHYHLASIMRKLGCSSRIDIVIHTYWTLRASTQLDTWRHAG